MGNAAFSLTHAFQGCNEISDKGAHLLIEVLNTNTCLLQLDLVSAEVVQVGGQGCGYLPASSFCDSHTYLFRPETKSFLVYAACSTAKLLLMSTFLLSRNAALSSCGKFSTLRSAKTLIHH